MAIWNDTTLRESLSTSRKHLKLQNYFEVLGELPSLDV